MGILSDKLSLLPKLAAEVADLPNLADKFSAGLPVVTTFSSIETLGVGESRFPASDGREYTEFVINQSCVFNRDDNRSYKDQYKATGPHALVFRGFINSGSIIDAPEADIYITGGVGSDVKITCRNLHAGKLHNPDVNVTGKVRVSEVNGGKFICGEFYADKLKGTVYIACKRGCAYSGIVSTGLVGNIPSRIQILDASSIIGGTSTGAESNFTSRGPVYLAQFSNCTINAAGQELYAAAIGNASFANAAHIFHVDRRVGGKASVSQNPPPPAPPASPPPAAARKPAKRRVKGEESRIVVEEVAGGKLIKFPKAYSKFNSNLNTLMAQAREVGVEVDINEIGGENLVIINTHRLRDEDPNKAQFGESILKQAKLAEKKSRGHAPKP